MFSHFLRVLLVWICLYLFLIKRASLCFASTKRFELFVCEVCFQFRKPIQHRNLKLWFMAGKAVGRLPGSFVRQQTSSHHPSQPALLQWILVSFEGREENCFQIPFQRKMMAQDYNFISRWIIRFFFSRASKKKVATTKERLRLKDSMRIKMKAGKARPDIQVSNRRKT